MPAFVALLRGVNVGKAKRVAMADWRAQLQSLGYSEVTTLLNSGNAVFCAKAAPSRNYATAIAAEFARKMKFSVQVVVKSSKEFSSVVVENPFANSAPDPSRVLVAFAQNPKALDDLRSLAVLVQPPEGFSVGKYAAYLHLPKGILQSKVATALLGKAGESVTTRNWATSLKLQALLTERES